VPIASAICLICIDSAGVDMCNSAAARVMLTWRANTAKIVN
jgi:hypothetical protein